MKRKTLAIILAVLMILPITALSLNAENFSFYLYLNDITGGTGTLNFTASAVNAPIPEYATAGNQVFSGHEVPQIENGEGNIGSLKGTIVLADPTYYVASRLGPDYLNYQTVAPRMQMASNYKVPLHGSGVVIAPLALAGGECWNGFIDGAISPTTISYAYSTDPIPAVNTAETDDNYGYIVYDPDNEDEPEVGSAAGIIQNGFVITFTSEGQVGNATAPGWGTITQATRYIAALYEDGEIIAVKSEPIMANQGLYFNYENMAFTRTLWNQVSFDGSNLTFRFGDGEGYGVNNYVFSATDGDGWENLERLSPYTDFYYSVMCGSPETVSDRDNHVDVPWGASSFAFIKVKNVSKNSGYYEPKDTIPSVVGSGNDAINGMGDYTCWGKSYPDRMLDAAGFAKADIGIASSGSQVNETTHGMRVLFEVNDDMIGRNSIPVTYDDIDYIGLHQPDIRVCEIGILFGKDTRSLADGAGAWRQNLTFESDLSTIKSSRDTHGTLIKKTVFENGVQTGNLYDAEDGKIVFTGLINNIPADKLDTVYMMNVYAILSSNGVPFKAYYANSSNRTLHNYYNRAVAEGAWSTGNSF